jgi:hypothetical protein
MSPPFLADIGGFCLRLFEKILSPIIGNRLQRHQELSELVYRPLYEQIYHALGQVENGQRPAALDFQFWDRLKAGARTKRIPQSLKLQIESLFRLIPTYDKTWIQMHEQVIPAIRQEWDLRFGVQTGGLRVHDLDWPRFFADPDYVPVVQHVRQNDGLRLWNLAITETRLAQLGLTPEGLLRQFRREIQDAPSVTEFQTMRAQSINNIADLLRSLDSKL